MCSQTCEHQRRPEAVATLTVEKVSLRSPSQIVGFIGSNFFDDRIPGGNYKPRVTWVASDHKTRDEHREYDARNQKQHILDDDLPRFALRSSNRDVTVIA